MKPMNLQVTNKFYKKIREFFFPDANAKERGSGLDYAGSGTGSHTGTVASRTLLSDEGGNPSLSDTQSTGSTSTRSKIIKRIRKVHSGTTLLTVQSEDDSFKWDSIIDPKRAEESRIMAERARANHSFVYIKIPQVPLTVSYQTGKVNRKHIKFDIPNIENFRLDIPLLEYKSELLTWQERVLFSKGTIALRPLRVPPIINRLIKANLQN